ncbi:hypothetical protein ACQKQD_17970 [Methylobacterium sp. NPDC080182]|uniref:hypothetical protein n=1 Tax=Methylobacterium sp. NPDC080182 TaxID=3390590 RepID=UPI003D00FE0F
MKYGTGWREREALGKARLAERINPALAENLKIAADRLQAERDAVAAATAEQERRRLETMCVCVTCSGVGRITVEDAATALAAYNYFRSKNLKPDVLDYAKANAGVTVQAAPAPTAPTAPVEPVKPAKSAKKAVPVDPPWLDPDAVLEP